MTGAGVSSGKRWGASLVVLCVGVLAVVAASGAPSRFAASGYIDKPIDARAPIEGCDSVTAPGDGFSFGVAGFGADSYDNPDYPWYSGPKATAMSQALVASLPSGTTVEFAPPSRSLEFQPITDYSQANYSEVPAGIVLPDLGGEATASGTVSRKNVTATLSVTVEQKTQSAPACVAGAVDQRLRTAGGAVIDLNDTWREYPGEAEEGVRTYTRSGESWLADGSRIQASMSSASEAWPMTRDELVELVSVPGLTTTADVPPGTEGPDPRCSATFCDAGPGAEVTESLVDAWNSALATSWPNGVPGLELGRPLASLRPADFNLTAACAAFDLTGPNTSGTVSISVSGGHDLPVAPDPYNPQYSGSLPEQTTLSDGSVEVVSEDSFGSIASSDGRYETTQYESVLLVHPSGYAVTVSANGAPLPPVQLLRALASTPGLDGP